MVSLRLPAFAVLAAAMVTMFSTPAAAEKPKQNKLKEATKTPQKITFIDSKIQGPGYCDFSNMSTGQRCVISSSDFGDVIFMYENNKWILKISELNSKKSSTLRLEIELNNSVKYPDNTHYFPWFEPMDIKNNIPILKIENKKFNIFHSAYVPVFYDSPPRNFLSTKIWQDQWTLSPDPGPGALIGPVSIDFSPWRLYARQVQTIPLPGPRDFNPSWIRSLTISFWPGGIPEPATWAMLIAGFGLIGLRLRKDRAESLRKRAA